MIRWVVALIGLSIAATPVCAADPIEVCVAGSAKTLGPGQSWAVHLPAG